MVVHLWRPQHLLDPLCKLHGVPGGFDAERGAGWPLGGTGTASGIQQPELVAHNWHVHRPGKLRSQLLFMTWGCL